VDQTEESNQDNEPDCDAVKYSKNAQSKNKNFESSHIFYISTFLVLPVPVPVRTGAVSRQSGTT
jgi:hypothetical protein